jgi:Mrp family chromosome partitioning ATPase
MSKNFELLQQVGGQQEIYDTPKQERPATSVDPTATGTAAVGTTALEPTGMTREEITKLVQRLFLIPGTSAPHTVVFAGTETSNGCSWLAARAAEILASQVTGSVCLLDCNLRSPSLHQQFGLENHFGLSEALSQSNRIGQYLRPLSMPNLWLLSSGSPTENGAALLGSDRMRARLRELRGENEYLIVDAGALDTGTDGIVLGSLSDGVVLVLKANSSRRDSARKSMKELQAANVPILGVVLNRRTFPIPEAIYKRL